MDISLFNSTCSPAGMREKKSQYYESQRAQHHENTEPLMCSADRKHVSYCRSWLHSLLAGIEGPRGAIGRKGVKGRPGPCSDTPEKNGFLFTRHSQKLFIPDCPAGSSQVYSGYSLLFINGNNRAHGQDLGTWDTERQTEQECNQDISGHCVH